MIRIFKRKAWTRDKSAHGGYRPYPNARKLTVCYVETTKEAQEICRKHNDERKKKDDTFCEFEAE